MMQADGKNEALKVRIRLATQAQKVRFVYDEQTYKALLNNRDNLLNSLQESNKSNQQLNEKLLIKSQEIQKQREKFKQQIHAVQAENNQLRDLKNHNEDVIAKITKRLDNLEKGSKLQTMAISNLSVEICQLKATNNKLVNQLEKVQQCKLVEDESIASDSETQLSYETTPEDHAELIAPIAPLRRERDRLLDDRDEMTECLKSQLDFAKQIAEMKEEEKLSFALKFENDRLKESNERLNHDLHCAKRDLSFFKQKLMIGKYLWENLKCEYDQMKDDYENVKYERAELMDELERTKSDYRLVKRQITILQQNASVLPSICFGNGDVTVDKLANGLRKREKLGVEYGQTKIQTEKLLQDAHVTST